jgi:hypothetical protein
VLISFLDESYTQDRYYIAAFIIESREMALLRAAVADAAAYAEGFGVPPGAELHAHEIMSGKGSWAALRGQHRSAIAIYQRALTNVAGLPGIVCVRGVDIPRLRARYRYPDPPHRIVLQHVLEEVSACGRRQGRQVRVVADELPDQDSHTTEVETYRQLGTIAGRPARLAHIETPITFACSATTPGLQVADLIAYLYRRYDGHVEKDPRTRAEVEKLWQTLAPVTGVARVWTP